MKHLKCVATTQAIALEVADRLNGVDDNAVGT